MELIDALQWRYAVKKYNQQKVSDAKLNGILEAIRLSASSSGIQPYRVFVLNNSELRKELEKGSNNPQITEASHLLAFAAFNTITTERITEFIEFMASERGISSSVLAEYKSRLEDQFLKKTDDENFAWSSKQAYIALGTGLIAAADAQIDATPMEGFNPEKLDELLNLPEKGLKSVFLMALGYRDAKNDFLANQPKVRIPLNKLVIEAN